jgi:hypothetical protein
MGLHILIVPRAATTTVNLALIITFSTSTRNIKIIMFLGSKARLVRKADNLTAIYERLSGQSGILNTSQPYIALLFLFFLRIPGR